MEMLLGKKWIAIADLSVSDQIRSSVIIILILRCILLLKSCLTLSYFSVAQFSYVYNKDTINWLVYCECQLFTKERQ